MERLFKHNANTWKARWFFLGSHGLFVVGFVAFELFCLKLSKISFRLPVLLAFYIYNFAFFFWFSFKVLPYINAKFRRGVWPIAISFFCFIGYLGGSIFLTAILQYLYFHKIKVNTDLTFLGPIFSRALYFFAAAFAYWYARYSVKQAKVVGEEKARRLEAEKREAEMRYLLLRNQFEPHFLFNILANIHRKLYEKAPAEAEQILALSNVLRYAVDHSVAFDKVYIQEDVAHLGHLVSLYRDILNSSLNLELKINIPGSCRKLLIPPLLFVEFIQNIVKHGDLSKPDDPAVVEVAAEENELRFFASNRMLKATSEERIQFGLNGVRERLNFLFGSRYSLEVRQQDFYYRTELIIKL